MATSSFPSASVPEGLTTAQVADLLCEHGPNELPSSKARSLWATARDVAREPMFLLLLACGGIYLLLGDVGEAIMLLGFVFVVLGITLYQERKTERALEALRDLSSPRALVVRDGRRTRIAGRDVVPGDILVISEGDRVPADSVVLESGSLAVDESLLTGESVPVRKTVWDGRQAMTRPGGEDLPFLFSGTLVVQGQGLARVLSTGLKTEMGHIGKALETVTVEQTHLQREIGALVRRVALVGAGLCAAAVVLYGLTRGDWLQGVLAGITLAMAMLPEEFPVVLTIFLALGAWRLSRMQVLARRVPVIETLGSATVLCVDKTGTLTQNRMTLRKLVVSGSTLEIPRQGKPELPEEFHEIVEFGILASQRDPFDPMEKAFHDLGNGSLADTEHLHSDWSLAREYPLSPSLLAMSHVWKSPTGDDFVLAAKGAPEAVADLCHLEEPSTRALNLQVGRMAGEGLRVLGVAKGIHRQERLPGEQHDFTFEFLGLVGLEDPLRDSVPAAVGECHQAGMRVVMITGDHPTTARSIARQAGLDPLDLIITGAEVERLPEADLRQKARHAAVFARMVPEHKLRLVNALKANGEVVAMTGDGVNDAPALKAAHIGIAMGGRGTDVAREASSLVLLDDDFASIVRSVRMGRRIYDHLRKAMTYIIAVHVPIAGMSLIPVLLSGAPLALSPVHILFLELVIDPACSIVFEAEPENPDLMRRPPRSPSAPLFGAGTLLLGLAQGLSVLAGVLVAYLLGWLGGLSAGETTALSFVTLTLSNLGLIFVNRSWTRSLASTLRVPNPALWAVCGGTLFFLALVLFTPGLRGIFHFTPTAPARYLICVAASILSLAWFEVLKRVWRWKKAG